MSGHTLTCPSCGRLLQPHVGPPEHAPWLCTWCGLGWHIAELTDAARRLWNPVTRCHGTSDAADDLRATVTADLREARTRGVNHDPAALHVDTTLLARIADYPLATKAVRRHARTLLTQRGPTP